MVHRDLKPSKILVNENCDLKISDIGFVRDQEYWMSEYSSSRYYRAPEVISTCQRFDELIDIWSVGCVFAELLQGKVLFLCQNDNHHFHIIAELLGTPPEVAITRIANGNVCTKNLHHISSYHLLEGYWLRIVHLC